MANTFFTVRENPKDWDNTMTRALTRLFNGKGIYWGNGEGRFMVTDDPGLSDGEQVSDIFGKLNRLPYHVEVAQNGHITIDTQRQKQSLLPSAYHDVSVTVQSPTLMPV